MRIQVVEHYGGAHHSNYIEALVPALADLVRRGIAREAIVTTTERHVTELQKNSTLAEHYAEHVRLDPSLPESNPNPSLKDRSRICSNLIAAVERVNPCYLVSTSSDFESLFLGLRKILGRRTLPRGVTSVGIFHYGYAGTSGLRPRDQVKEWVYRFGRANADYSHSLFVNPMIYEALVPAGENRKRMGLLPDPVPPPGPLEKSPARETLGLPSDGRLIGFVGVMDTRKAIPELIAAFIAATLKPNDRLLLAGRLDPSYRSLIEREHSELLREGRILLLDRHLSSEELAAGYAALDVAAVLQYRRPNLSANLLKAIAAQRPVLVDDFGYTGMMVKRFGVGRATDLTDRSALASTLRTVLDESATYAPTPRTKRLIEFHHPTNFAKTILGKLEGLLPSTDACEMKTWEWVCDAAAAPALATP